MNAALELFDVLDVRFVLPKEQHRRGSMETCAVNIVDRLIRKHGLPHATLTLRTVVESEGNQHALVSDIIEAVSDVIRFHPRWANLGLQWMAAFDKIALLELRKTAKGAHAQPLRVGIASLICFELEKILGPSVLPKPPKIKREPKPPAYLARVPGVEKNVRLGLELLALRSSVKNNREFGRQVRAQFDVDAQHAGETMKVARLYGARPEIITHLSWNALLHLASPALSAAAREALERRILAGERIGAPEIREPRGALKARRSPQPAKSGSRRSRRSSFQTVDGVHRRHVTRVK